MRLLLDENVPKPLYQALAAFILNHEIIRLLDVPGWSGTRDETLYPLAAAEGFHVVVTNDGRQMQRPREVGGDRSLGPAPNRVSTQAPWPGRYGHCHRHSRCGSPRCLGRIAEANGQRLIALPSIDPTSKARLHVIDPLVDPPKFWVSFSPD